MIIESILLILYKLILDYTYINYVSELYSYQGFSKNLNIYKMIIGTIVPLVLYFIIRINNKRRNITNIIVLILFLVIIVPTSVIFGTEDANITFYSFINIGFLLTILIWRTSPIKIKQINFISENRIVQSILLFSLFVIALLIFFEGLPSLSALNLNSVYEIRRSSSIPRFLSYLSNWQTKVFSLFLLGYSLFYKKKILFFFTLLIQIIIYMITAHKIVLFAPLLIIFVYIVIKYIKNVNLFIIFSLNFGVMICYLIYRLGISEWPASLLIRRVLLVPVKNSNYVYEYFSNIEKIKLSNSIFRGVFQYPYEKGVYYLIGERYYGNPLTNANASYLADAFLQFGLIGILLISIILGILLWFVKCISFGKPEIIVVSCILLGFFVLSDSAFQTSLLTNGILIGIVLILLIKKEVIKNSD